MKPTVVRQAADAADDMIRQNAAARNPAPEESAPDGPAESGELSLVSPVTSETPEQPATPTAEETLQAELAEAIRAKDLADQRYRSLEGMYHKELKTTESLRALLAASHVSQEQQAAPAPEAPATAEPAAFNAEDADRFGEDLCEYIDKRAEALAAARIAALEGRLATLQQSVTDTSTAVAQTREEKFYADLDGLLEGWKAVNADPEFVAWIQADDFISSEWVYATSNLDAARAAKIMSTWVAQKTPSPEAERQRQLQQQVAPDRSRADRPTTTEASQPKQYTRSEIAALYASMAVPPGRRPYTPEQFNAIEADIVKATREGRVTQD